MDNFDLKKFVSSKSLLKENSPGYDESQLKLAEISFGAAGTDKRSGQVIGEIIQMIRDTGIDPSDVLEEVGQEFGIAFEFGRGH